MLRGILRTLVCKTKSRAGDQTLRIAPGWLSWETGAGVLIEREVAGSNSSRTNTHRKESAAFVMTSANG